MRHDTRPNALERMLRPRLLGDLSGLNAVPRGDNTIRTPKANQSGGDPSSHDLRDFENAPERPEGGPGDSHASAADASVAVDVKTDGLAAQPRRENRKDAPSEHAVLMGVADAVRPIRAADGRYFAAVVVGDHVEYYRLGSDELRRSLIGLYQRATGRTPRPLALASVEAALRSRAEKTSRAEPVFLRVARDGAGPGFLLDLADPRRHAVAVSAQGWELLSDACVLFWRPPGQRGLPLPAPGGSTELLKNYVNLHLRQWPLLIGWLTAALRPCGPYPVLVLTGEQGSAKTTLAQVCRRLVDPNAALLRSLPRNERDLMVSAHNNWLLAFDNVSKLADWQSDALCRLSTGGGFAARGLYSDDRETVFYAQRPIILNGIDDFVTRGDLIDRSIFLSLPRITPASRRGDHAFWADFDRDYPALLGGLLDAVAGGIRHWPGVTLAEPSRMADLDRWGEAVLRALGSPAGTFVSAYHANRQSACADALEQSPVAAALVALLEHNSCVQCTPTELFKALDALRPGHASSATGWPQSPWALSRILNRIAAQLRVTGIDVTFARNSNERVIRITRNRPHVRNIAV